MAANTESIPIRRELRGRKARDVYERKYKCTGVGVISWAARPEAHGCEGSEQRRLTLHADENEEARDAVAEAVKVRSAESVASGSVYLTPCAGRDGAADPCLDLRRLIDRQAYRERICCLQKQVRRK